MADVAAATATPTQVVIDRLRRALPATIAPPAPREKIPRLLIAPDNLRQAVRLLLAEGEAGAQLVDLTAIDHLRADALGGAAPGSAVAGRFELLYHIAAPAREWRLQLSLGVDATGSVPTVTDLCPAATWPERELFDLFGIEFDRHAGLERLLLPPEAAGHPLRKEYPLDGKAERWQLVTCGVAAAASDAKSPRLELATSASADRSLRIVIDSDGETIETAHPIPGYAHSGIEKLAEAVAFNQFVPLAERLATSSSFAHSLAYVLACERILDVEVPARATAIRVILAELTRIGDHFTWMAGQSAAAGDENAIDAALEAADEVAEVMLSLSGARTAVGVTRVGGVVCDFPDSISATLVAALRSCRVSAAVLRQSTRHPDWRRRCDGLGAVSERAAIAWGLTGPALRASGVECDVRREEPYLSYAECDFDVPIGTGGDVSERAGVRLEEIVESTRIVEAVAASLPGGPVRSENSRVTPPEPSDSPETLIRHFELWMDGHGMQPDVGATAYVPTETARGEFGCLLVSDGTDKPYRLHMRSPSLMQFQILGPLLRQQRLEDAAAIVASMDVSAGEMDR